MPGILHEYKQLFNQCVPTPTDSDIKRVVPTLVGSFLAIYSVLLFTDGYYFLVFLVVGFGLGGIYFSAATQDGPLPFEKYERHLVLSETTLEQFSNSETPEKNVQLFYPPLTTVVNQLLDYVMRDFVTSWWTPLNEHKDPTFEKLARERLNVVFLNIQKILLNQDRNDIVMSTVYGVANTLIIHMRECRALEDSHLTIDHYVKENPQSPFSQLLSRHEQHRQLRALSQTFLKRTLPAQDRDSLLLMSLLKELLANFVFGSVLENLSDPDFLNRWIIDLLSDQNKKTSEAITSTISAAVLADTLLEKGEEDTLGQVTPPSTPEPQRSTTMIQKPTMIFSKNSVHFTIMDISAPQVPDSPLNKHELVYIIQIERPAMEDHAGSEGGGYVITRSYTDFETFHTLLHARHPKRANKLQLRLPLQTHQTNNNNNKSWLNKSASVIQPVNNKRLPPSSAEAVGQALERYMDTVVQDIELGTDPILLSFLRKERRSDMGSVVSFTQEFKEEADAALASLHDVSRSRSMFSRHNTRQDSFSDERNSLDDLRWFGKTRAGSVSSLHSNLSKNDSPTEEEEGEHDLVELTTTTTTKKENKALSPMDVELLIETTYALIVEIFNLTSSNNKAWMRRSMLNLLREIVRRTYTEFISEQYSDFVHEYMSPDAMVGMLNTLGEQFWPEGKWMLDGKEEQTKRTEQDKEESKQRARQLLMTEVIPNAVRQLIGDQNCNTAMDRIWARCQDPQLNRVLILQVLERIIKPILG
ncbi:PXA domain-containing protein [Mucor mucedo]|uniref:PXA domain-containing protein n=1 Tax=Mucor mucedo TaxID=29922 RepID=UPI002220F45D|nr:PXA domain-containing protein [Mucor mucedo]KAI7884474.1 PXA domain-containing protein [Mucor mucedo]